MEIGSQSVEGRSWTCALLESDAGCDCGGCLCQTTDATPTDVFTVHGWYIADETLPSGVTSSDLMSSTVYKAGKISGLSAVLSVPASDISITGFTVNDDMSGAVSVKISFTIRAADENASTVIYSTLAVAAADIKVQTDNAMAAADWSDEFVITAAPMMTIPVVATPGMATLADIAKAEDIVAFQLIASNLSSITTTIEGIELTVTKASVSDAIDGRIPLPDVSAATGVEVGLPASLFDAVGVERALVLAANLPASAVPAGAPGMQVEGAISITLKSVEDGSTLSVTGLPDPIFIDLPNVSDGLACAYFDEAMLEWSSEGMATTRRADGTLRCATTHLTVFGAILKGFVSSLECSQASLLSAESYVELWTGDWLDSAGSVLLQCVMLLYIAMLLTAHACDVRDERAGRWGTREFVVPELAREPVACPTTRADGYHTETTGVPPVTLLGAERANVTEVLRKHFCLESSSCRAVGAEDRAAAGAPRTVPRGADHTPVTEALRKEFCKKRSDGSVASSQSSQGHAVAATSSMASYTTAVGSLQSARQAVQQDTKASCEELLQGALLEVVSIVTKCVDGVRQTVEVFVSFVWELLRGNFGLKDLAKTLAEWNATNRVCASLLMHPRDVDFLLSPEVQKELEPPAPGELDSEGAALRTLAGSAAEGGVAEAKRRHDMLAEMVGRVRAARESALRRRRSRCHAARTLMLSFLINCPVGAVFVRSIIMRRSMRVLLLGCELTGAVMIATFFFASTGGALAKDSPEECNAECDDRDDDCMWQALGELIAVGVVSALLASIPLSIIKLAHQRHFVRVPTEGCREWELQLGRWRRRDALVYVLGTLYSLFAINYVALFFANVSSNDHLDLISSAGVSFAQGHLLFPLLWAFVVTSLALCV